MSILGPNSGNIYGINTAIGVASWINTSSAQLSDDAYATIALSGGSISRYITATSFGLALGYWNRVTGIEVLIEKSADSAGRLQDYAVRLLSSNLVEPILAGNDLANSANLTTTDAVTTYGSSENKWGVDWQAGDVGLGNFGVAYAVVDSANGLGAVTARIDQIRIRVYYYPVRGQQGQDNLSTALIG